MPLYNKFFVEGCIGKGQFAEKNVKLGIFFVSI